jgi:hypothetical protein
MTQLRFPTVTRRRIWIAAAWLAGTTVPAAMMAVFLFGCCVLPFHQYVHRALPLCGGIVKVLAHGGAASDEHAPATAPARKAPVAPVVLASSLALLTLAPVTRLAPARAPAAREALAHGAVRCESDVGLHLLHASFLI